jgi:phage terminase small subunit
VDAIVDLSPVDEVTEVPVLTSRKRKALDALKIDMVADTFSPGVGASRRGGRRSRLEGKVEDEENDAAVTEVLEEKRSPPIGSKNAGQEEIKKVEVDEEIREKEDKHEIEMKPSENEEQKPSRFSRRSEEIPTPNPSLMKQLKMDLVDNAVTPSRLSRRKGIAEEIVTGRTGNKALDQLKVDMVVDAVLPTRGKRRAEGVQEQKGWKKIRITPVDQIPSRLKIFSVKVFKRIQKGEISRSEGHQQLQGRVPGLTHSGFGKEYTRWARENPVIEEKAESEPDTENKQKEDTPEVEADPVVSPISKEISVKLVNILAVDEDIAEDDRGGANIEKLKAVKESLIEILSAESFNPEEKLLLKEIKELIRTD